MRLITHLHLVQSSGAIPQLPQYIFMAWCLVKQRGNFTFIITYLYILDNQLPNSHALNQNLHRPGVSTENVSLQEGTEYCGKVMKQMAIRRCSLL